MTAAFRVFVDGEHGTTGLQIVERLARREELLLIRLPAARRKDLAARAEALAAADVAILCLPDEAAREAVAMTEALGAKTRLIDASTAHRTAPGWVYGFPELEPERRAAIVRAERVANPGCWATCALAILRPLVRTGMIDPANPPPLSGVSGYSGGGRAMIAEFESGVVKGGFLYALDQTHKHIPEIMAEAGLQRAPVFVPSVGQFAQGMALMALFSDVGPEGATRIHDTLADWYCGARFVKVVPGREREPRLDPQRLNGTNFLELSVHGNPKTGTAVVVAVLDNLGKGAAGAAVQNLNLMLGLDEAAGL